MDGTDAPVEYLSVMIVREEFSGGIVCEDLIHEVTVHNGVPEDDEEEEEEEGVPGEAKELTIEVISGEAEYEVEIPLAEVGGLTPTIEKIACDDNEEDESYVIYMCATAAHICQPTATPTAPPHSPTIAKSQPSTARRPPHSIPPPHHPQVHSRDQILLSTAPADCRGSARLLEQQRDLPPSPAAPAMHQSAA